MGFTLLAGLALYYAVLLRPDGLLLTVAVLVSIVFTTPKSHLRDALLVSGSLLAAVAIVLLPWALRNAKQFGVFRPLAPRYSNNPDEWLTYGFLAWNQTWEIDFNSSPQVFWNFGSSAIDVQDLPARAFDDLTQLRHTENLISVYNATCDKDGEHCHGDQRMDDRFNVLTAERVAAIL